MRSSSRAMAEATDIGLYRDSSVDEIVETL